jgi:hypothetical protein
MIAQTALALTGALEEEMLKEADEMATIFGSKARNVMDYGAVGNGVTNDAPAFQTAFNATPENGVVIVPGTNAFYRINSTIRLPASRSLRGFGWPILELNNKNSAVDLLIVESGLYDDQYFGAVIDGILLRANASGRGRDLIRINGGDHVKLSDLRLLMAGRDGIHIEPNEADSWTENFHAERVYVDSCRRDAFNITTSNFSGVFINQSTFIQCESRSAGRYALALINNDNKGEAKISALNWFNGELDATGGSAADVVFLQSTAGRPVEHIIFENCAIEDMNEAHSGHAIGISGSNVGPVATFLCISFGVNQGMIDESAVGAYYNLVH